MKQWTRNFNAISNAVQPQIAVVVASYNNPRALELCLEGYTSQSFLTQPYNKFHLIVADDGSGREIEQMVSRFTDHVSFPVSFLHQEHKGWGKLKLLNRSVLEAKADRIIFTDGDCIPHKHFVRSHFGNSSEKVVCCGRRVDLMETISSALTVEDVRNGKLDSYLWLINKILKGETDYPEQGFFLPIWLSKIFSGLSTNSEPTILGSNFSIHKKWLLELNGFDETFVTPGYGEDYDLERRLKMIGLNLIWITYRAIQFHVWHPLTMVGEETKKTFESLKQKGNKTALKGIKELQQELAL